MVFDRDKQFPDLVFRKGIERFAFFHSDVLLETCADHFLLQLVKLSAAISADDNGLVFFSWDDSSQYVVVDEHATAKAIGLSNWQHDMKGGDTVSLFDISNYPAFVLAGAFGLSDNSTSWGIYCHAPKYDLLVFAYTDAISPLVRQFLLRKPLLQNYLYDSANAYLADIIDFLPSVTSESFEQSFKNNYRY